MKKGDSVSVRLFRFDPDSDKQHRFEEYSVPYQERMRIIDALNSIYDGGNTFAYRWYCGTKKCGMCAVMVNGKPLLSCWEPVQERMTIEPLSHFRVIRDLVVDFAENERRLTGLRPVLVRDRPYQGFPEKISHDQMKAHYDLMPCIDCRICVASCEVMASSKGNHFAGPYALVQLAKIVTDPRGDASMTNSILDAGIEACKSCNSCTVNCPAGVPVLTGAIDRLRDRAVRDGVYWIRGWGFIKRLPPSVRRWTRCKLGLTLGEGINPPR